MGLKLSDRVATTYEGLFQTDPRGVEASSARETLLLMVRFRRTLVGLKHETTQEILELLGFRRTLVGLKPLLSASTDWYLRAFQTDPRGVEAFPGAKVMLWSLAVSDGPSWG